MSIKTFNPATGQWEQKSTTVATGIKIVDLQGKFESPNVNGALSEIADTLTEIKGEIKYIYENGTIGGGSGGGGSSVPTVTIDGPTELVVNSDQVLDIFYFFNSPNAGSGEVNYSIGAKITKAIINQGRNRWTIGPFARGTHILTISVMDKQGFWTVPAQIKVISGSLEIESTFNDSKDYTLAEDIIINFNVITEVAESVFLDYVYNGSTTTIPAQIGANTLNLGKLTHMGTSSFSMTARNSKYVSNEIKFILVAADALTLTVSTTFENNQAIEVGKFIQIPFRNSMKYQATFNTDLYLNGTLVASVESINGPDNTWDIGRDLAVGHYIAKITSTTLDGKNTSSIEVQFDVVAIGFTPYRHVTTGLVAKFDGNGKLNNSTNKNKWEDSSGNETLIDCSLYNFNYYSNGWIDSNLVLSGKSYAVINLKPFLEGVKEGFTFDMKFKIKCVGDINAKVVSCKNPITPYQGFEINTSKVFMSTIKSENVAADIQDDTWTNATFVVNRANNTMIVYINGIISSVAKIDPNDTSLEPYTDQFTYDGKIYLGGTFDAGGVLTNNSVSSIKGIRIYNRALTDDEVLTNYIADVTDQEEQMKIRNLNTSDEGMPTLSLFGDNILNMGINDKFIVGVQYKDPQNPAKNRMFDQCLLSWQGTSSTIYPIKNYTLELTTGDGVTPLVDWAPKDEWRPEPRWTLKANYMDSSSANNVATNKLIYDLLKPRPYPSELTGLTPSPRANVDGFPIRLVINGNDCGIYTWNIDRYAANNYGFITYNADGTIKRHQTAVSYEISVNGANGAGAFKDDSWEGPNGQYGIRQEFKHRWNYRGEESFVTETVTIDGVPTKVLKTGAHSELVELVTWVTDASDDVFRNDLKYHFSIPHLIDYYLIAYVFGMVDNLGKNMVISTWGKDAQGNTIWYPSFYDCDSLYGLNNVGIVKFDAGLDMANGDYNTSNSALWEKLRRLYSTEIVQRYGELRQPRTIDNQPAPPLFSYENIMPYIEDKVIGTIGQKYYNADTRYKYLDVEGNQWLYLAKGSRLEWTKRWLKERFVYMDSVFQFQYENDPISFRTYVTGEVTLRIKTYSPQWIQVNFTGIAKAKKYVSKEGFVDFTGIIDNGTDNDLKILGASNIMYIEGLKELNAESADIANAEKLVEVDLSNNSLIREVVLGSNTYLQKVLLNNCKNLGYEVTYRTLDVSQCQNLKILDCSNSHIANVKFNDIGGVLETLNCSKTDITSFVLTGQEYLQGLQLDGCADLSELVVKDCNGLQTISMRDTKLATVMVTGCDNLISLDISLTKNLKTLDLTGCPNLKALIMNGSSLQTTTTPKELDLSNSLKLETLDIGSTNINLVTFGQYTENGTLKNFNALKTFKCNNSSIQAIRYGKASSIPAYLDLYGLSLTDISFDSCTSVTEIRNLNLNAANGAYYFNNCTALVTISGSVKLSGSLTRAFYNCAKLTTLPNLDLSGVTSMSETFVGCKAFTMTTMTKIMTNSSLTNKFVDSWRVFAGCTGIIGALPYDTFKLCTGLQTTHEFFSGCSGITGSPDVRLLQPLTSLTSAEEMFVGCSGLNGTIPDDFLKPLNYNPTTNPGKLTNINYLFANTKITNCNVRTLLNYQPSLKNAYGVFEGCTELITSPDELMFAFNYDLESVGAFFNGCSKVYGNIPRHIFNRIPTRNTTGLQPNRLKSVQYFFAGTQVSGNIPAYVSDADPGLLDLSPQLDTIQYLFSGCSGLTGRIPTNFLKNNNLLTTVAGLFNGCTNLGDPSQIDDQLRPVNIPPNLLKGKSRLIAVEKLFRNCSNLYSIIPIGFLDDCPQVQKVTEMFAGCSNLNGQIPERISYWVDEPSPINPDILIPTEHVTQYGLFDKCTALTDASSVFSGCTNMSSTIPPKLLLSGQRIVNLDYMFNRCFQLNGGVPKELFANCVSLQSAAAMFQDCVNLWNNDITEDYPWALPPELFKNCPNLTNVSTMFCSWGSGLPNGNRLNGEIPPDLFSNNAKLTNVNYFLTACSHITGTLDSNLFKNNTKIASAIYTFSGTGITGIGSQLFWTCTLLRDMSYTFNGCSSLTGLAPEYWSATCPVKATIKTGCFRGDTGLSNYSSIDPGWV